MRSLKIALVPALLILTPLLSACVRMPVRRAEPPEETRPRAQIDFVLVDQLGRRWSVDYLQVYLDGWLVWQGVPPGRSQSLGTPAPASTGKQEVYVRVIASRHEGRGQLASARKLLTIQAGSRTVRIRLRQDPFNPGSIRVALAAG